MTVATPLAPVRSGGFTLIEVLAVVFMTTILMGVALNFYVDLSNASARATELTREARQATSLLDRVARDFEGALLIKKAPEADPLAHPWVFLAESRRAEGGSDHVKFNMRARHGRGYVMTVAYMLEPSEEDDSYSLLRWSTPELPEGLDREFPSTQDPATFLLADGIDRFGVRFLGADGEWVETWDSSQLIESSELPAAVEIELALVSDVPVDPLAEETGAYRKRVILPVRPLDTAALFEDAAGECASGLTLADCVDMAAAGAATGGATPAITRGGDPRGLGGLDTSQLGDLQDLGDLCFDDYRSVIPAAAIKPECL